MINALHFRDAIISGANSLSNHKEEIDRLNVFPVPDGDTGTNMSVTIKAGAEALLNSEITESTPISQAADLCAQALLCGARGNSGVILSLLFKGFADGCKGKQTLDGGEFATALLNGVEQAYKAVLNPTEGTILTVSKMAAKAAELSSKCGGSEKDVLIAAYEEGQNTLSQTTEMLPLLKKAGVVDAGGQGYVALFEGILHYLKTGAVLDETVKTAVSDDFSDPEILTEEEITFTYCTEVLINKAENADCLSLREQLSPLGDSLIVADAGELVKIHIHTDHPGKALEIALEFGYIEKTKIENMRLQFRNRTKNTEREETNPVTPEEEIGFVAVCAGKGLSDAFSELGCGKVIFGGQTMNPSAQDIADACLATGAKTVFVLPNNSNVIMAAAQAAELVRDRNVVVIPTKTVPQGIAAAFAFDPDLSPKEAERAMTEAAQNVRTGLLTTAARDSEFEGKPIRQGEIIALNEGKLVSSGANIKDSATLLADHICNGETQIITLFCGEDAVFETTQEIIADLEQRYPDVEIQTLNGGQPVYSYMLSAE